MFSGIIEACEEVLKSKALDEQGGGVWVQISRPSHFADLKPGDSVSVNGVCLTVSADLDSEDSAIPFVLGAETLKLLGGFNVGQKVNLERSLRFGDRVHGHFVTGHVDAKAQVKTSHELGVSWILRVEVPTFLSWAVWKKGSVAINGVSLTINECIRSKSGSAEIEMCLIPETLQRTNLGNLHSGDWVHIEVDSMARAFQRMWQETFAHNQERLGTLQNQSLDETSRGSRVEI